MSKVKIGVVSDTHGYIESTVKALRTIDNLDFIIHLGDYISDAKSIEKQMDKEVIYVKGNCDVLETDAQEDRILEIKGRRIFITHGHKYDVKNGVTKLFFKGKELKADIILYGHSHMSTKIIHEDVLILNPGSPNEPRSGSKYSIGLIELAEKKIKSEIIEV